MFSYNLDASGRPLYPPRVTYDLRKVLVVFGATGKQGGSAINCILKDRALSKEWQIRAVTRNPSSPEARALKGKDVEIVAADMDDGHAVKRALDGADTIYLVTTTNHEDNMSFKEIERGKSISDAAAEAGAKYIIFRSMPNVTKLTDGKLPKVEHFDAKAEIEAYIRKLPIASAFIYPGLYMRNFLTWYLPSPTKDHAGTYAVKHICNADSKLPLLAVEEDMGKWVTAILADPDKFEGKILHAATGEYTFGEAVEIMSKVTGKNIEYVQVHDASYKEYLVQGLPSFAEPLFQMCELMRDYNFFGPRQKELLEESAKHAQGKLTTLEDFLRLNPLKLE